MSKRQVSGNRPLPEEVRDREVEDQAVRAQVEGRWLCGHITGHIKIPPHLDRTSLEAKYNFFFGLGWTISVSLWTISDTISFYQTETAPSPWSNRNTSCPS